MRVIPLLLLSLSAMAADAPLAFATWAEKDPCTTLTVRMVFSGTAATIRSRRAGGDWQANPVAVRPVPGTTWSVAGFTLGGLKPDEKVEFDDGATPIGAFRTLRERLDPPLRLAIGGDLLHEQRYLDAVCLAIAPCDPEAAVIGGDWAYDNGEPKNFDRWLALLGTWQHRMRRADGCGVPMVAGIGNHELKGDLKATPFAAFFPEPTARAIDIGSSISFLLLDSGHSRKVADQDAWLEQALAERKDRTWRFAVYHVPAYPSVRKFDDGVSPQVREHWVPRFERGGVAAAFENHDHALKRTLPLLGGKEDPSGITYIGDGCWGVTERTPASSASRPFLAMSAAKRHAWMVEIGEKTLAARAIGEGGQVLDRVELKPRPAAP